MARRSKRYQTMAKPLDLEERYTIAEAVAKINQEPTVKFDESVDISVKFGVDPRKADQLVRGTIALPHGTGKTLKIVVFAKGDKVQAALDAGAEFAGSDELLERVRGGWTDFDAVIATPDMMREVGKLGKILGPRGLMPTPKAGTVTADVATAVKELAGGKVEFKVDRHAVINNLLGKRSFSEENLTENIQSFLGALVRAKPPGAKGTYIQSMTLSATMGMGYKLDLKEVPGA